MNRAKPRVTTALLARRARALRRYLKEALEGDDTGVHQARVASRRLREAVPVLAAGLRKAKAGKATRKIRQITQALGSIRELDVTVALLDELARRDNVPRLALEAVRARVVHEEDRRRVTMLKRLGRVKVAKLDRRLASLSDALDKAETHQWRETLAARLLKRSKLLHAAVTEAGQLYEAERLHKVRIAAKKLRYTMELASETGMAAARRPVLAIKRTQDTLGRLHDLQVVQAEVAAVQAQPSTTTLPEGGLDVIAHMLEDECRHLHATYLASVPALQSVIEVTRTTLVPQLAHPPRSARRHLKMQLPAGGRRPGARTQAYAAKVGS